MRFAGSPHFTDVPVGADEDTSDEVRRSSELRERLASLLLGALQMQNLAVLAGSGASLHAGGPSMTALWEAASPSEEVLKTVGFDSSDAGLGKDIEALLSRCEGWLTIHGTSADACGVATFREKAIGAILNRCRAAGTAEGEVRAHVALLRKLARRRVRDSRLQVFTTNYDRCFELAAGELGMVVIDGFSFTEPRRYNARYFDMDVVQRGQGHEGVALVPGVIQLLKLHGSVNWRKSPGTSTVGAAHISIDGNVSAEDACLIYPARTKYQLSFRQPHLELMARFWSTLRTPNTSLVVVGFGFNDDHLSAPILSALDANPSLRVVVVDPDSEDRLGSSHTTWSALARLADEGVDVSFVAATFEQFVQLVPDLKALTPAERLARDVVRLVESEP